MNSQRTMIYKQSFTAVQEYAKNTDLQTFHGSAIIRKETGLTNTVSQQYKNSQRTMIYKQCFTAVQEYAKNHYRLGFVAVQEFAKQEGHDGPGSLTWENMNQMLNKTNYIAKI